MSNFAGGVKGSSIVDVITASWELNRMESGPSTELSMCSKCALNIYCNGHDVTAVQKHVGMNKDVTVFRSIMHGLQRANGS